MRITNTMISDNAAMNINGNKISVDANNTRMTTQKKIDRPSEDPVIAIRSLRLQTSLNKVNQYYEKNIPDANSWMDVTETALLNIRDIMTDIRTLCVQGATDTLTEDDRATIYNQLKKFQEQVFAEGNADYAGRTVFTGFRTDKDLAFMTEEKKTSYKIQEPMEAVSMVKSRFYTNKVEVPTTPSAVKDLIIEDGGDGNIDPNTMAIQESDYYKLRLAYNLTSPETDAVKALNFYDTVQENGNDILVQRTTYLLSDGADISMTDPDGNVRHATSYAAPSTYTDGTIKMVYQFDNESDWALWSKTEQGKDRKYVPDGAVVIIKDTGDLVFAEDVATTLMTKKDNLTIDYDKTGFQQGELKPEYYFDSRMMIDNNGNKMGVQGDYYEMVANPTGNPADQGWYVFKDGEYVLTKDTSPQAGRAYFTQSTGYIGLQYDRYEKSTREVENASGVMETRNALTKKELYSLEYTVAQNQQLGVNLEAEQCFNHDIYQDMSDMINAVGWSQAAHDKVDKIKAMMKEDQYQPPEFQDKLNKWLEIANKEMDYYDNNLSKLYTSTLGKLDTYLGKINLAITDLGCRMDQLNLTEKRMSEQQDTVEELKSNNDNLDLSQIIMDYTSSYTAYQSSLIAAGKLGEQTLLNYI